MKRLNLDEWEEFGGGYTAASYYNKTDDTVMMKLYEPFIPEAAVIREYTCSDEIKKLGIDVPKPICIGKTDTQTGVIFERIKDKVSVAKAIANDPDGLDGYMKIFTDGIKKIHSTPCNTEFFPNVKDIYKTEIEKAVFFDGKTKEKLIKFIENVPDADTCLHGDCHIGNMILSGDRAVIIDVADWAYGNPMFDIGLFYYLSNCQTEELVQYLFHISGAQMRKAWEKFVELYYPERDIDDVEKEAEVFGYLKTVSWANRQGLEKDPLLKVSVEKLIQF